MGLITISKIIKHLNAAIKLEQTGVKKYTEFAQQTTHYYGKLMFERLAMEEEKHTLILESWKEKLDKLPGSDLIDTKELISIKAEDIFPSKRNRVGITKNYISALTYAIDIEEKSCAFYKELEDTAEIPELKELFKKLAAFENEHMKLFKSELDFVQSNPMSF